MQIIDGKKVSESVKAEVKAEVLQLNEKGISVGLAVILVGDDPASKIYIENKKKACQKCGIRSFEYLLPESTTTEELISVVNELNNNPEVNGILCQLPLPSHLDESAVINAIDPKKDVDAFHPVNVGKIMIGNYDFLPCTPAGIIEMLKFYNIEIEGKTCVVIGRSNIVGKPMAMLLMHNNGTVTVCHRKTKNLTEITKSADILVVAVKKPEFLSGDMVKDGAVVIDVGINRVDGKLYGDVNFPEVSKKASYITPVPGGVGPMTIAILMKNTLTAAKKQNNI